MIYYRLSNIQIPQEEFEITTSRSGGPGGQHVNKTNSRITIRWNAQATKAFPDEQKKLLLKNLSQELTNTGELIITIGTHRSQLQNKEAAITALLKKIKKALYIPKKRIGTKIPGATKEKRLMKKSIHSILKKNRQKKILFD